MRGRLGTRKKGDLGGEGGAFAVGRFRNLTSERFQRRQSRVQAGPAGRNILFCPKS